jgi:hypothetical protein
VTADIDASEYGDKGGHGDLIDAVNKRQAKIKDKPTQPESILFCLREGLAGFAGRMKIDEPKITFVFSGIFYDVGLDSMSG